LPRDALAVKFPPTGCRTLLYRKCKHEFFTGHPQVHMRHSDCRERGESERMEASCVGMRFPETRGLVVVIKKCSAIWVVLCVYVHICASNLIGGHEKIPMAGLRGAADFVRGRGADGRERVPRALRGPRRQTQTGRQHHSPPPPPSSIWLVCSGCGGHCRARAWSTSCRGGRAASRACSRSRGGGERWTSTATPGKTGSTAARRRTPPRSRLLFYPLSLLVVLPCH